MQYEFQESFPMGSVRAFLLFRWDNVSFFYSWTNIRWMFDKILDYKEHNIYPVTTSYL